MWRRLVIPAVLVLSACRTTSGMSIPVGDRDVILAQEIAMSRVTDVYQAILQLRPEFLKRRGPTSVQLPQRGALRVYLDNTEMGGPDVLHTIAVDQVTAIRYLSASEATLRWGPSHAGGVILVSTARTLRN